METRRGYINSAKRDNSYFKTIDTEEKAYILGFILGDAALNDKQLDISVSEKDKDLLQYICDKLECDLSFYPKLDKKKRIFPHYRTSIGNREFLKHLLTQLGSGKKKGRRFPRVKRNLLPYIVLGFFDADGCITWGRRRDRGRLWQKVCFTADITILSGLQNILSDYDIAMQLRPVKNEDCYVLEITNELNVYKIFEFLPLDFSPLKRKRENFNNWVDETKKKYQINIGDSVKSVSSTTLSKYFMGELYAGDIEETVVDVNGDSALLSNGLEVSAMSLAKKGTRNYALRLKLDELGETYE